MKVSFAPWRVDFILGKREKGCVFCTRIHRKKDRPDLILHRGKHSFVILNKYPYNNGHLMVVPNRHICQLSDLTSEESLEMMEFLKISERTLKNGLAAQGINGGLNLGKAAGAGIDDHLHFHMVPRWTADTNFWPVIAEVKSMPLHLMTTYDILKKEWKKQI